MTIIELGLSQRGYYQVLFTTPDTGLLLADFLVDDVGRDVRRVIEECEDNEEYGGAMNATQYTKEDGVVVITPEYRDEDVSIEQGYFYSIKASVLADLLRQWQVVYKGHPSYITITIIDDKVSVIGSQQLIGEREGRALHLLEDR